MKVVLILFLQPWLLKKCSWIIWGGDLYRYRRPVKTVKNFVKERMRKIVIKNIGRLLPLVEGDYYLAKKWYNAKGTFQIAKYINMPRNEHINYLLNRGSLKKDTVNIHVGNSATKTNNHFEVFEKIKKYKDENIKIFCPLSYGDLKYAEEVKKAGKEIFGEKFVSMDKFMDIKEFLEHMNTIDVGIFNNDRQQGFGNINELLFLKKKVFISNKNTLWNYYNELGIKVYSINDLNQLSFKEFMKITDKVKDENHNLIRHRFSNRYTKVLWEDIFNY